MDLTPRSHATHSPHFYTSACHPIAVNASSPYPTPPQSCAQTAVLSANSPATAGLGIFSPSQISMCSPPQSFLQPPQEWQRECGSSHAFSPMGAISDLLPFEEAQSIVHGTQLHSATSMLYSSPAHCGMAGNEMMQRFVASYHSGLHYQPVPVSRQGTGFSMSQQHQQHPQHPQHQQMGCTIPWNLGRDSNALPFDLEGSAENTKVENHNSERLMINNRILRIPLGSSRSHVAVSHGDAGKIQSSGIRKQARRNPYGAAGKYTCEKCGMKFTRNSNCKSHMKIHDPNRKFPYKCAAPQCTQKFTRKTDLERHVDSVHKKLRQHGCDQCGHYFARQDTLRRHREDGCRRELRQAQRKTADLPVVVDLTEPHQPPPVPYGDPISAYLETIDQKLNTSYLSPYLDDTANAYPQYL
ncbi:hypothetical protein ACO22_03767 [Paracoccidioides brasiliensis]|uniref:C2H2-type domain-containing protein n=1 Tax=Paracoccidioides brasiliensis TaxID=121759 RepID=A0A1D2JF17_PARBR|nr:hypothetical protein ACO22_03767 [Paracoccidioides brasiliensis]